MILVNKVKFQQGQRKQNLFRKVLGTPGEKVAKIKCCSQSGLKQIMQVHPTTFHLKIGSNNL